MDSFYMVCFIVLIFCMCFGFVLWKERIFIEREKIYLKTIERLCLGKESVESSIVLEPEKNFREELIDRHMTEEKQDELLRSNLGSSYDQLVSDQNYGKV